MNHLTQSFLSSAVVSAVLWVACGANPAFGAIPPGNTPPNYQASKEVGSQLKSGEANATLWNNDLLGQITNYNTYSEAQDDGKIVGRTVKGCKDEKGNKTFACNFAQKDTGMNLKASTLLGTNAFTDPVQRSEAIEFIKAMTNATPMVYHGDEVVFVNPKKKDKGLSEEGIAYYALIFKQIPMLSIAQNSLLALFAERERLPGLAGSLPVGKEKAASILEMLEYEASRRYMDPAWFEAIASTTDQAVMREMAYMMAFQNFMAVKDYEQNQRIEALLVANISAINGMNTMMASQGSAPAQEQREKKIKQKSR